MLNIRKLFPNWLTHKKKIFLTASMYCGSGLKKDLIVVVLVVLVLVISLLSNLSAFDRFV